MSKKIKVLHFGMSPNYGGIESYIVNNYLNIDKNKISFDFINNSGSSIAYEKMLIDSGSKIFPLLKGFKNYLKIKKELDSIVESERYDFIHFHLLNNTSFFVVLCALRHKNCRVIIHSHTSGYSGNTSFKEIVLHNLGKLLLGNKRILRLACSDGAGEWLHHNKKYEILNNGIDSNRFRFNKENRLKIRKKYKVSSTDILIGNVTNYSYPKNNMYLLKLFLKLYEKDKNYKLVLIGDDNKGIAEKSFVKEHNIEKRVIFTGIIKNVNEVYSAMDLYICPSIIEGFNIALLEATVNGLLCFVSNKIIKQQFPGKIKMKKLDIDNDISISADYVDQIYKNNNMPRSLNDFSDEYDVKNCSKKLEEYYYKNCPNKDIVVFNPSLGTQNVGDSIISNCIEKEMNKVLSDYFVVNYSSHNPISRLFSDFFSSSTLSPIKYAKYKFLFGANTIKFNLFIRHPDLNINIFDIRHYKDVVAVGVGSDVNAKKMNFYTRFLYRQIFNKEYIHSTRDERTKNVLESLGLKAVNTGCPTLWGITDDLCSQIPHSKSRHNVVFTLTCYDKNVLYDQRLIDILKKNYKNVYFFPQGYDDLEYFKSLKNTENVIIINPNLSSFENLLKKDIDYVGTRLHAGIFSMRHKKRSIILTIDNRARDMEKNNNLVCIERENIDQDLDKLINKSFKTCIKVDRKKIDEWKSQFN